MAESLTTKTFLPALNRIYDTVVDGSVMMTAPDAMAAQYLSANSSPEAAARSLVNWQSGKAGAAGFVTGLGGLITLPVAIPANLAATLALQIQMIAAIAHMGGHDVRSEKVRTLVFIALTGNAAADILKDIGIKIGTQMTKRLIAQISGRPLTAINQRVGIRLLTKAGASGLVNLGKIVPLIGGVIGGGIDIATTQTIGSTAIRMFITPVGAIDSDADTPADTVDPDMPTA